MTIVIGLLALLVAAVIASVAWGVGFGRGYALGEKHGRETAEAETVNVWPTSIVSAPLSAQDSTRIDTSDFPATRLKALEWWSS